MATSQQFLVCDNSTAANFTSWASAVSNILRTFGWTNTADTGQLNGAGAGNWAGVTTVPGSSAFYYEIFKPGDALTAFYLKLEYGNGPSTNSPTMRISLGTGTNGAGTLTGYTTNAQILASTAYTAPSTTTTFECNFSGTSSRLTIMMWRNGFNNCQQGLAVQRSLNSSGSETGTYATLWGVGYTNTNVSGAQQTIHFTAGLAPYFATNSLHTNAYGWPFRNYGFNGGQSSFNGSIPIDFLQPMVGFWDYPCTVIGGVSYIDVSEGVPFTITNQYGQTKTYIPSGAGPFLGTTPYPNSGYIRMCMEFD